MTEERRRELEFSQTLQLTDAEFAEGWHWCNDWDGLLVGPGMGEMEFCLCAANRQS